MKYSLLTFRFTRRAIGAAAIQNGEMTLLDGRFLSARQERTIPAALRYVDKILAIAKPNIVVIDSPGGDRSTLAAEVRKSVEHLLKERGMPIIRLETADIVSAFGVTQVVDRRELRELMNVLCPELVRVTGKVKPYVADAAAAALHGELCFVWNPNGV